MKTYQAGCNGCLISQGAYPDVNMRGGIIHLHGDWTLNHYGGDEGFLGWMILQPRFHRMDLNDLAPQEVASLGGNIQAVDAALRQYWRINFPDDPIQRVYVVYFHESVFGRSESSKRSEEWHLHFHLVPRTVRVGRLLRKFSDEGSIRAWSIPEIVGKTANEFPPEYKKDNQNMQALVANLRAVLSSQSPQS